MRIQGKHYNATTCMNACFNKGRLQFALIYDGDCNCGLPDVHEGALERAHGKTCGRVCASEVGKAPTHYCGDADKRAVYKVSGLNSSWVGCYRNSMPTVLAVQRSGAHYTSASCMQACFGYSYMALQGSLAHCFCGNENGEPTEKYRRVADVDCGGACAGEEGPGRDRRCGAEGIAAVYRLQSHTLTRSEARMVKEGTGAGEGAASGVNKTAAEASETLEQAVRESEVQEVAASQASGTAAEVNETTSAAASDSEAVGPRAHEAGTASAERQGTASAAGAAETQEIREATNIVEMVAKFDIDGDYTVNRDELSMALSMVDPDRWTVVAVQVLLYGLDTNQDDKLQFEEIAPWLATASNIKDLGPATSVNTDTAAMVKQHATGALDRLLKFDLNGDKKITPKELAVTLKMEDPVKWTPAAVKKLLHKFDDNSDNELQYTEFLPWIMYQDGMKSSTTPKSMQKRKSTQTRRLDRGHWRSK